MLSQNKKYASKIIKKIQEQDNVIFLYQFIETILENINLSMSEPEKTPTATNVPDKHIDRVVKKALLEDKKNVFENLNYLWPMAWQKFFKCASTTEFDKELYILNTIEYASLGTIEQINEDDKFAQYINEHSAFMVQGVLFIEKIKAVFAALKIKINNIPENYHENFLNVVYEGDYYKINKENLELLLETYKKAGDLSCQYTRILSLDESKLFNYVHENINKYIDVLLNYDVDFTDNESTVVVLLNNGEIDIKKKAAYIRKLNTVISCLNSIKETVLWKHLLLRGCVVYNEANILKYYFDVSNAIDDPLIVFINSNQGNLFFSRKDMEGEFGQDNTRKFFFDIIQNDKIDIEKYSMLLEGYKGYSLNEFSYSSLSEDKMNVLINYGIIKMNAQSLLFIRENYAQEIKFAYIIKNINDYLRILDDGLFDESEAIALLSENIADKNKLTLLPKISSNINICSKMYSKPIQQYILQNNFNISDLPHIVQSDFYNKTKSKIQATVQNICIENIESLYGSTITARVDFNLLKILFSAGSIDIDRRKSLLNKHLTWLSFEQILICFQTMHQYNYISLLSGGNPKINKTEVDLSILKVLKNRKFISSFDDEKDRYVIYTYGKRKKKAT